MNENILLVGTGALSTLFAARLSETGHRVSMLGTWTDGLQALNRNGARIADGEGRESNYRVHATKDPNEVKGIKHAIVLVKSWQTERAADQLKRILAPDGIALTLQNGLGNRTWVLPCGLCCGQRAVALELAKIGPRRDDYVAVTAIHPSLLEGIAKNLRKVSEQRLHVLRSPTE